MKISIVVALLAAGALASAAVAQPAPTSDVQDTSGGADASVALVPGEVRKVDKEAGKLTLRHETIASLGMPPMTMVFRVSDPSLLDQVKTGDKVRFSAERKAGQMIVTRIEVVR